MAILSVKEDKSKLEALLLAPSPSGIEDRATNLWRTWMEKLGAHLYYYDHIGNYAYSLGEGKVKILLSGHIDEVNSRISHISKNGIITAIQTGGQCKKSLVASHVAILCDNGRLVEGIVQKKPIHCEEGDAKDKVGDIHELRIDIGAESAADVDKMGVNVGNPVIYSRSTNLNFGENKMCSQGLDDKIGVFIVGEIMQYFAENKNDKYIRAFLKNYTLIGLAATQEETGLRGAQVAAKEINADISIDFDVTFATDGEVGLDEHRYGDIRLGGGAVIQFGPDKSERINKALIRQATMRGCKYQRGVSRAGGTDTSAIQLRSKDCETTLISIPNRNMHTPVEVCDWRDVQSIVEIVASTLVEEHL